jgi:DNA-directed RNA polymerase subunit RPC12/RpoP
MSKENLKCKKCGSEKIACEFVPDSTGNKSYLVCVDCGHKEERNTIVLIAEIDLEKKPNSVSIHAMSGDKWTDFGYCLEVCGFMLKHAAVDKKMSIDELVAYAANYLKNAAEDYVVD